MAWVPEVRATANGAGDPLCIPCILGTQGLKSATRAQALTSLSTTQACAAYLSPIFLFKSVLVNLCQQTENLSAHLSLCPFGIHSMSP